MKTAVHQYEDKLLEFAYGELPAHEASAVEAHVRGCARCGQALDEIRSVRSAMAQLPQEPAPDAGLESLLAFAESAAKRNAEAAKPVPFWKKYLTPLVLVATMVTVGVVANQANKEVDLSPAAAASDKTAEDYSRRDERKIAKEEGKQDVAPAPVAAVPMPEPERQAADTASQGDLGGAPVEQKQVAQTNKPGAGPKGGEASDLPDALGTLGKRGTVSSSGGGSPQSVTRREMSTKGRMNDDDFSPYKVAPEPRAKDVPAKSPPPPVQAAVAPPVTTPPADQNAASGYGLTGGTMDNFSNSGASVRLQEKDQKKEEEARKAPEPEVVAEAAVTPAPTTPKEAPRAEAKPDPKPSSLKKSKSISLGGVFGGSSSNAADDEFAPSLDKVGTDGDAKLADRRRDASAATAVEQAKAAAQKGDRQGEVKFAAQAVSLGAAGSTRLEALTHLCNGYEALGQFESADSWCDLLLREFPNSSTAQTITQRRGASQQYRAAPAPKKATSMPAASEKAQ